MCVAMCKREKSRVKHTTSKHIKHFMRYRFRENRRRFIQCCKNVVMDIAYFMGRNPDGNKVKSENVCTGTLTSANSFENFKL